MTVTDQIKILDRKIMQNEAQYDLDRKAAKISALSSNNLDKYEYLTGEDLGLKPSTVEQAKFEYSPLGKIFNKGLEKEEDKKEGLLKRLKNIEDKNEEQLKAIKNKASENIKEVTDFVKDSLSLEAKHLIEEIRVIQKDVDYRKLKIRGGNNVDYNFSDYETFKELFKGLYYRKITIDEAEREQVEFNAIIGVLENYTLRNDKYIEAKNKLLNNVKKFTRGEKKILKGLKTEYFRLIPMKYRRKKLDTRKMKKIPEMKTVLLITKGLQDWNCKIRDINDELVRKHFLVQDLGDLLEKLWKSRNSPEKNKIQVNLINGALRDLKGEIEDMSEQEKETENPNEIVNLVENILEFNRQQQGQGLQIIGRTPSQMLSRLPISPAQLKAGNNSEKLKNEIRQLLYSLYRSKKLTKQLYKSLVDII